METSRYDIHPTEPRWTHVALRVDDIEATIDFYTAMTPLELIDRRQDDLGFGAWLGMPGATGNPFILVVAQFLPGSDPFADAPKEVLAPFAHLGIEVPTRMAIDEVAARAEAAGCLAMPPTMMPPPIGYICMVTDPDGNMIEFSWDQGVYATLRERFGEQPVDTRTIAEAYLAALSAGDAGSVVALVTDDFVNEHTSELGSSLRGRAAYAERLPGFLGQFAALHYEVIEMIAEGDLVSVQYRMTANFDGHPLDIPGVMLVTIRDGLVARRVDVWDSLTFLRQTGAAEER